ncbi:hypothetical protein BDV06DRAFT_122734 [Aspergillus oleicola]
MWPEQSGMLLPSPNLRKRKMEALQSDVPHCLNHIKIIPSHLQSFGHALHLSYMGSLEHKNDRHCPQFLTRKRRVLPHAGCHSSQPVPSSQQHTSQHISMNQPACLSANPAIISSAVSPRTSASKSSQPNICASPSLLRPCHICHRRPTTKELLEAYADCELCGHRACFVCLRQCDGSDCCSRSGQQGQEQWENAPDNFQPEIDFKALQNMNSRRICSCCAVEGVTETGEEVVQCLACIKQI